MEFLAKLDDDTLEGGNIDIAKVLLLDIQTLDAESVHVRRLTKRITQRADADNRKVEAAKNV